MPDLKAAQVANLKERMEDAVVKLNAMAEEKRIAFPMGTDYDRLRGKAEGVRLALSYLEEYLQ
ncbi:MAG TPA: hypothetical protein PLB92_08475 [Rhodoglobus sp.]|nr:hypothetical protein [Rhodoglobus sp.]